MARRTSIAVLSLLAAAPATAGTLRGWLEVVEKGGKRATDLADAVVWRGGAEAAAPARRARRS